MNICQLLLREGASAVMLQNNDGAIPLHHLARNASYSDNSLYFEILVIFSQF